MSQEVRTNPSVLDETVLDEIDEPASTRAEADPIDLLGNGHFPMESYANRLMDELFGEVDRLFEGGMPVEAPAPEEVVSLQPIAIPHLEVPDLSPAALAPLESDSQIAAPDAEAIATLEPAAEQSGVNRWLLAAVFASAIAAGVSWLVFFRPASPPDQLSQTAQPSQADQQFANYVQRSLDRIAGRAQTNSPTAATAASPALPSVAVPSSVPNTASSVPDRVYVPVYQPPQTLYPPAGVAPVVPPAVPPVAVAPAAPLAPRPATVPTAPRSAAAPTAPVAVAPAPQQTLMGLMQFGDRSAALFEVSGSPQRISVGENIGSSGWTLVSVSNDVAVIRRNGEVRSIYVGQQF